MGILGNPNFAKIMQKKDIKGCEKSLEHEDPSVRKMAMATLYSIAKAGGGGIHVAGVAAHTAHIQACWAIAKAFHESEAPGVRVEAALCLRVLYKSDGLPEALKKAVRPIMPTLENLYDEYKVKHNSM